MESKSLQDKELNNVVGGENPDGMNIYYTYCNNCGERVNKGDVEHKLLDGGCGNDYCVWKCPGCGKWIDTNGDVAE